LPASASPPRFTLRDASPGTYPLLVVAGDPIVAIAPILIRPLRFGIWPEAGDRRPDLLLPDHRHALDGLRSVDGDAIKMMRTLDARAGRSFAAVERDRAAYGSAAPDRRRRRGDRRRICEWAGAVPVSAS